MKALLAQAAAETRMTLRRGETLLLTLGVPVGLLDFLSVTKVLPAPGDQDNFLVPGILALAIMSTSLVSLGIATAFQREYKVLKRLGATPLGRPRLVIAKILSVVLVEGVQAVVVLAAGLLLGWRPGATVELSCCLAAFGASVAGTAGFSGLGLLLAGRLRADAVLAVANGPWPTPCRHLPSPRPFAPPSAKERECPATPGWSWSFGPSQRPLPRRPASAGSSPRLVDQLVQCHRHEQKAQIGDRPMEHLHGERGGPRDQQPSTQPDQHAAGNHRYSPVQPVHVCDQPE